MLFFKKWQQYFKLEVYYDEWCPMCASIRHKIEKIDWMKLITLISIRDQEGIEKIPIPQEELETRMYANIARNNRYVSDIRACSAISARIPILWPLWPLLLLAQLTGVGSPLYHYIAKNRRIIPVGACDELCKIENIKPKNQGGE